MGHWPKNNKNRVQTFAGGVIWVDVRENLFMGCLSVLPNDEEMLQSQEKFLGPKNNFPKFGFRAVKFFCVKRLTNIQIVTHPYLGRLWKNVLEVFHDDIANFARGRKWVFFDLGTKYRLIPSGAIWTNVREK